NRRDSATTMWRACVVRTVSASLAPRHQQNEHALKLGLLDRPGGVDILWADHPAFPDKSAFPNGVVAGNQFPSVFSLPVWRIEVVAHAQCDCRRAEKLWLKTHHGARRITEHAIDAHGELFVACELRRRLAILPLRDRLFLTRLPD